MTFHRANITSGGRRGDVHIGVRRTSRGRTKNRYVVFSIHEDAMRRAGLRDGRHVKLFIGDAGDLGWARIQMVSERDSECRKLSISKRGRNHVNRQYPAHRGLVFFPPWIDMAGVNIPTHKVRSRIGDGYIDVELPRELIDAPKLRVVG